MNYTKQLMDMASEVGGVLQDGGLVVKEFYVITGSVTKIYENKRHMKLLKEYKTTKAAINWLKNN